MEDKKFLHKKEKQNKTNKLPKPYDMWKRHQINVVLLDIKVGLGPIIEPQKGRLPFQRSVLFVVFFKIFFFWLSSLSHPWKKLLSYFNVAASLLNYDLEITFIFSSVWLIDNTKKTNMQNLISFRNSNNQSTFWPDQECVPPLK